MDHSVLCLYRFRYDMLIGGSSEPLLAAFADIIIDMAAKNGFTLNLEESGTSVPFLNTRVGLKNGKAVSSHCIKPSALESAPLDGRSGQAWHVHETWPASQIAIGIRLGSHSREVAGAMINRFRHH